MAMAKSGKPKRRRNTARLLCVYCGGKGCDLCNGTGDDKRVMPGPLPKLDLLGLVSGLGAGLLSNRGVPTEADCKRACEVLIQYHVRTKPTSALLEAGVLKHQMTGGPRVAVYTISGHYIAVFDAMLSRIDPGWAMGTKDDVVDVRPVVEIKKIEGER